MTTTCIVCGKLVAFTDQDEHLKANHLGPHYFWFDARKFKTDKPSDTISAIKAVAGASPLYQVFEERDGGDLAWGDGQSVDLTHFPHFYAVPPATMWVGS
jgi:hypothetical protein